MELNLEVDPSWKEIITDGTACANISKQERLWCMLGTTQSSMFPKLIVHVGEIEMKELGWTAGDRAGGPRFGGHDEECRFYSHVSGGPVGGTEAGPRW